MRVLGIDPGYDRLGIAVVENNTLIFSACVTTSPTLVFNERLVFLGEEVTRIITSYHPEEVALEKLYFTNNQKTAMSVAQVIGMISFIAGSHGLPIHEYTPPQIKVACTSNGRADKKQMMTMIPLLITMDSKKRLDDEYDAIAVALTHLAHCG